MAHFSLGVGDVSGSQSEGGDHTDVQFKLVQLPASGSGEPTQLGIYPAGGQGKYRRYANVTVPKGPHYQLILERLNTSTDTDTNKTGGPNSDYRAVVVANESDNGYIVVDKDNILNADRPDAELDRDTFNRDATNAQHHDVPISSFDGKKVDLLPVEVVSRDKFLAGSIEIPQGWDSMQLEFVNTTTSENLGKYGNLLGGGTNKIYNSVADIMNDPDVAAGVQAATQKVWFVKDSTNPRKIAFYTCFNALGDVQVKLYKDASSAEPIVVKHTLTAASDFAFWIKYTDDWVKGIGFDFGGGTTTSTISSASPPPPSGSELDNLTRACLIPMFLQVVQVEGAEAVFLGLFDGCKAGLIGDAKMVEAVVNRAITVVGMNINAIRAELIKWQTDPLYRARQLMRMEIDGGKAIIMDGLQAVKSKFANWDYWRDITFGTLLTGPAGVRRYAATGNGESIVSSLHSWYDDFSARMMSGGERAAFLATPWDHDVILQSLNVGATTYAYSIGYVGGFAAEQVGMGAVVGVVGKVIVRSGLTLIATLAPRTTAAVAEALNVAKQIPRIPPSLPPALPKEVAERAVTGISEAGSKPLVPNPGSGSSLVPKTAAEELGEAVSTNASNAVIQPLIEAEITNPKTRNLLLQAGSEGALMQRVGQLKHILGSQFTAAVEKNFNKVFEERLIVSNPGGGLVDFGEDLLISFKGNSSLLSPADRGINLASMGAPEKAAILAAFEDGGSLWKIDAAVTGFPSGPIRRGVVAETAIFYGEYSGQGWSRVSIAPGIDFVKPPAVVQVKTLAVTDLSGMKEALVKLLQPGRDRGCTQFVLDMRRKPGLDTNAMETALLEHIVTLRNEGTLLPGEQLSISIKDYDIYSR